MQQPGASQQPVVTQHDARALFDRGCSLSFTLDVSQGSGAEVTINLDLLHVSTFVRTVTAIDFSVKRVSASRNGHYLLLVGQQGEVRAHQAPKTCTCACSTTCCSDTLVSICAFVQR